MKSRKLLNQIFAEGKSFNAFPLKVLCVVSETEVHVPLKAGVGVSSRHFKKAVHRNRIKRLLRESYRLQKHLLDDVVSEKQALVLFFLYTGKELTETKMIPEKMHYLMLKMVQAISKKV